MCVACVGSVCVAWEAVCGSVCVAWKAVCGSVCGTFHPHQT